MIPYILALCLNLCLALAASRTSAPSGALVVSKAPAKGQYSKIQDAVDALSTSSTTAQSIFIEAGTYNEQVYIAPRKASLTIYGYSENTDDYNQNVVTITQKLSLNEVATDDLTATLRAWSTNFKLYNVNLANTYGQGKQALALNAAAANQGFYACKFLGYQDTILAQTGTQLFAKSYIEGATDFIFGQHGLAWFSYCDIRVLAASLGFVTASGRASNEAGYYVLDH
ncbi:pectin lyase-like protein, partial [Aureobasidium melanogenum]